MGGDERGTTGIGIRGYVMGVFQVPIEVGGLGGGRFERVDALVDTGASYTMLPSAMLRGLGIEPHRKIWFELADGDRRVYELGHALVRVNGDETPTVVVFGDDDMRTPLLGAYTLEGLALSVDPLRRRLETMTGRL